jgi:DUF1365 family protein
VNLASGIYAGWIRHRRHAPKRNEFRYRIFMMYLDLDELEQVFGLSRWWSLRGPAPVRFARSDYFGDPTRPLAECVRDRVEEGLGRRPTGPVRLLAHLRYYGYCFNPVSLYYCFAPDGKWLEAILAEVTNTPWNERHTYVLDARPEHHSGDTMRFQLAKEFHVSPFLDMDLTYDWRFHSPGEKIAVHMEDHEDDRLVFDATLSLQREEITPRSLRRILLRHPWMTLQVIVAIHWQAVRLWWKRVPFFPHPDKRSPVGHGGNP